MFEHGLCQSLCCISKNCKNMDISFRFNTFVSKITRYIHKEGLHRNIRVVTMTGKLYIPSNRTGIKTRYI